MKLATMSWVVVLAIVAMVGMVRAEDKPAEAKPAAQPVVIIETSMGTIEAELFRDKTPITVENFLSYTKDKFFDGTVFHRVMNGFMIQGGGYAADLIQKKPKAPIKNEADNGLKNEVGTLAMARMQTPDSASSEFFINVENNVMLNHTSKTAQGYGYCVFGKVTSGMDVVNKIKAVAVGNKTGGIQGHQVPFENVPTETVTIKSIRLKE